ncbi:MAG: aa3-type cytochrome oxidase subunit II [Angustibacter sp.]
MVLHTPRRAPRQPIRRAGVVRAAFAVVAAGLPSGCSATLQRGWLPEGATTDADRITSLWNGSWIAALAVGVLVWGLTLWCVVAYRKRKKDVGLPVQLRYNVPIEILYTVVPLFMVGVLFFYTARDEAALIKTSEGAQLQGVNVINVVGKRWAWDFNYLTGDAFESTEQVPVTGSDVSQDEIPTLYLPVNERTQFVLTARDVIHSFWVPAFLRKTDMIPGRVNKFEVTPTRVGTFRGRCAELCGAYHSQMIFQVRVVPRAEYDRHLADLRARGQDGILPDSLNQEQLAPGEREKIPAVGSAR